MEVRRLAIVLAALGPAPALAAQAVRITVVDAQRRSPVVGAVVRVIDSTGKVVRRGLSNEQGRLSFRFEHGRTVRLEADRIGWRGLAIPAIVVPDSGAVTLEVLMPAEPIVLADLGVRAASPCVTDPATAPAMAALWTEIRKALDATAISKEAGLTFTLALWRRELSENLQLRFEETDTVETAVPRPFFAADPGSLVDKGWVVRGDHGSTYFGPDEATLLSPGFLATHCFHLNRRTTAGRTQLGLRFEPIRGRRLPDIEGTMWVDADRATLREVDYRYRNVGEIERRGGTATGRVEFLALPEGWWVVSRWSIRMPQVQEVRIVSRALDADVIERRQVIRGYLEDGGELVRVMGPPRGFAAGTGRLPVSALSVGPFNARTAR